MQDNLCGLCGNWDGDLSNDVRFRDGTIMTPPPQGAGIPWVDRQVEPIYGNNWEVNILKIINTYYL